MVRLKFATTFLVAHYCGYPLSRHTCRAARVAADFLDFIAFCRCSTGVALHPLKFWCRTSPPVPGGVAQKFGSEKVSRYTGVSQVQLRVSRYTVQLRPHCCPLVLRLLPATFFKAAPTLRKTTSTTKHVPKLQP